MRQYVDGIYINCVSIVTEIVKMDFPRLLETPILAALQAQKVVLLLGSRRVGKTRLLKRIQELQNEPVLFLNGDDLDAHSLLAERSISNYRRLLGNTRFLILDEAQEIPEIGKKLKLMVDEIEGLKVLASGSSAFELQNQMGEPLVGRMKTFRMHPIAHSELLFSLSVPEVKTGLEERLVLGSYPELFQLRDWDEKSAYLKELVQGYLIKDILAFEGVRKREIILQLLRKLAFRSGSEISLESLGNELQISKNTVEKYLDLFRGVFIVYDLPGFSRNLDSEMTKKRKWYFWDNGIRNALTGNFQRLSQREDQGLLWENYMQAERLKRNQYAQENTQSYFWRTHSQQEIDLIEAEGDALEAFEFKWGQSAAKVPPMFSKNYPGASFTCVHPGNYLDFIG